MQARKGGYAKIDISIPGRTTALIHYGPPSKLYPRGGTINRLERLLIHPTESWDSVIQRVLDVYDAHQTDPSKRTYTKEYVAEE